MLLLLLFIMMKVNAQVTVDIKIDSLELYVGEQTQVTLDVSLNANSKLLMPQVNVGDTLVSGVEIVGIEKADTLLLNEGTRHLVSQRYVITSFDSALYYLPPFVVVVDGKKYESQSLALRILSIPVDTVHVERFYGPKEIMDVPFAWRDWSFIFLLSTILLLWILGLLYLYIRYRDNKPVIKIIKLASKILPHTQAMQEIDRIKAEKVWAKEDSKEYYTRLTSILRTYIEKRYGFNAMEMTSTEIIDNLLKERHNENFNELSDLFKTADLVKFAKYSTLINENDANLVNAIDFINQTKKDVDENIDPKAEEVLIEQERNRRTLKSMRIGLVFLMLIGFVLLCYIFWLIYDLVV